MDTLVQLLEFPSSVLLAITFLLASYVVHHYGSRSRIIRLLSSTHTARILLGIGTVIVAVDGTWNLTIHNSLYFVLYLLTLLLSLSQVILTGIRNKAKTGFILNHLGIFLIIWGAMFSTPDVSRSKMMVYKHHEANAAFTKESMVIPLPFCVSLDSFRVEHYEDGISPRQYYGTFIVDGKKMETSVNNPISYKGYSMMLDDYDHIHQSYVILQMVRNHWMPVIYIGMVLLAIGSVMLLFGKWNMKYTIPVATLLTIVFTFLTLYKINFTTLMPALRSWWFVPHLFIYMVAYSLLAMALILCLIERTGKTSILNGISDNLVRSSSALLIIGMLCGSVWANQVWGDYWAWDPKENWAAATWFLTLIHLHFQHKRGWMPIAILIIAFLALQITWYGVNYLPSANLSLHTYMN